jgi:hypothetical protein
MRSLWRILARQWLGGKGSEALTEDSAILEGLVRDDARPPRAFDVRRDPRVSHGALMSAATPPNAERLFAPHGSSGETSCSELPVRYSR